MKKRTKKADTRNRATKLNFIFLSPVKSLKEKKLKRHLRMAANQLGLSGTFNLVFCNPRLAKKLNLKFRGKNYQPDILTFYYKEQEEADILLNTQFLAGNPNEAGARLGIHGLVHLTGLDHEVPRQQKAFFKLEQKILDYLQPKAPSTKPT